jgi:hypothetical protein
MVGVALVEAIQLCIKNELAFNYGEFVVEEDGHVGHVCPICRFNCTVRHFIQKWDERRERKLKEVDI